MKVEFIFLDTEKKYLDNVERHVVFYDVHCSVDDLIDEILKDMLLLTHPEYESDM